MLGVDRTRESVQQVYWLGPLRPVELLRALLNFFGESWVAIETDADDLSLGLETIEGTMDGPVGPFHREYGQKSRMTILTVDRLSVEALLAKIAPAGQLSPAVGAIQVGYGGDVQFLAGDNFHHECVSVGPGVPVPLLQRLTVEGVISGYYTRAEALRKMGRE